MKNDKVLLLWKQAGRKGCHALLTESLQGSKLQSSISTKGIGPETKRIKKKKSHSPVTIKETKNACVMKQDSIPQGKGIYKSENQKRLYHIPNLHSRYSETILIITLQTLRNKNILPSYKHLVCT